MYLIQFKYVFINFKNMDEMKKYIQICMSVQEIQLPALSNYKHLFIFLPLDRAGVAISPCFQYLY